MKRFAPPGCTPLYVVDLDGDDLIVAWKTPFGGKEERVIRRDAVRRCAD